MKRILRGEAIRDSIDKTVAISVVRTVRHAVYGKTIKKNAIYLVHDQDNKTKKGDIVSIAHGRKMSKMKSWVLSI